MRTSGAEAYGQIAWSWLSLLQSSLAEVRGAQPGKAHRQFARTREAKGKVGSRESAPYAVKHRAGKAGRSGFTCYPLCIACAFSSHDGQAGASRRPAFPAPFHFQGVKKTAKLGRKRREEEKACLRVTITDIVGWAKRKRAHASRAIIDSVGTALRAFAHPTALAVRPGHESSTSPRMWRDRIISTKKSPVDDAASYLDESTPVGP